MHTSPAFLDTAPAPPDPVVTFPHGEEWPALGLGTWQLGEDAGRRGTELAALRTAIDMGYRVIDTAEMYGDGGAERLVGEAVAQAIAAGGVERHELRIVTKAYPHHADVAGLRRACEASLRRLRLDRLDLYLLHWRGDVPLAETVAGMERLQEAGLIAHWGVSNFDLDDLHELRRVPGGSACSANQVYYSLGERGPEHALLGWQRVQGMPLMAYSPLDGGALAQNAELRALAAELGCAASQLALAWLLAQSQVMAIPKSASVLRLHQNWQAASLVVPPSVLRRLDALFPRPRWRRPLAMR